MRAAKVQKSPMIVRLHEIPPEGMSLELSLSGAWVKEALSDTDADSEHATLTGEAYLLKTERNVFAKGKIAGDVIVPCGRCASPAHVPVDAAFRMTFVPRDDDDALPEEAEVKEEDTEFSTYTDELIDLSQTFREQLLLAIPLASYCREDCKGLCAACGKELNEGPCTCTPEPKDMRFAALKNLKL